MSTTIVPFVNHLAQQFRDEHPKLAARCGRRLDRAIELIETGGVSYDELDPSLYYVRSQSNPSSYHIIIHSEQRRCCSCPDHAQTKCCKHQLAVWLFIRARRLAEIYEDARRYYNTLNERNQLSRRLGTFEFPIGEETERVVARLTYLNTNIQHLGRETFRDYSQVLKIMNMQDWQYAIAKEFWGGGK